MSSLYIWLHNWKERTILKHKRVKCDGSESRNTASGTEVMRVAVYLNCQQHIEQQMGRKGRSMILQLHQPR